MKRTLVLTAVLVALMSIGLAVPVSGIVPPQPEPCIRLEKTGPETATPGETITYNFKVTNCSEEVALASSKVYELPGPVFLFDLGPLAPGAYAEGTKDATVWDECEPFVNEAKVKGVADDGQIDLDFDSWTVDVICEPGGEGCTPGYWKQVQHFDSWSGASPGDSFSDVFGVDYDKTLLEALKTGGGGAKALGRHAAAAYLNALSPDVDYYYTPEQVIALVQEAYATGDFEAAKDLLAYQNEIFCPLD
jgi:hypothetical protein